MSVAATIQQQLERASWIRRMFEEGIRLKAERGPENVFDFTLGNPEVDPPAKVISALQRIARENRPGTHGYMPNAGFPAVREALAARLAARTGLPFTASHILMTVGSSGAINTFLKAILDPGDEVIVPVPCFSEYQFYIANHAGKMVTVETDGAFSLDLEALEAAVTPRTRAIILNSPHNPTGVVYSAGALAGLQALLSKFAQPITVISDEPYRAIVFDGLCQPETASILSRVVIANSWSKSQAISGERIGYLAISPRIPEAAALFNACTFTNRILGFINAPAIWQWVAAETSEETVDVSLYQAKRDRLWQALTSFGYQAAKPQGAFYLFPKTPIPDDVAFVRLLQKEGILAVPGTGFGRSGYMRLSLTAPKETIERSLPGFQKIIQSTAAA